MAMTGKYATAGYRRNCDFFECIFERYNIRSRIVTERTLPPGLAFVTGIPAALTQHSESGTLLPPNESQENDRISATPGSSPALRQAILIMR
jgi:hypothetical protein